MSNPFKSGRWSQCTSAPNARHSSAPTFSLNSNATTFQRFGSTTNSWDGSSSNMISGQLPLLHPSQPVIFASNCEIKVYNAPEKDQSSMTNGCAWKPANTITFSPRSGNYTSSSQSFDFRMTNPFENRMFDGFRQRTPAGTLNVRYLPHFERVTLDNGQMTDGYMHCITAMKEFQNKSVEELRNEDYFGNRKTPSTGFASSIYSFGSSAPFTSRGIFNSTAAQSNSTGIFGQLAAENASNFSGSGLFSSQLSVFGQSASSINDQSVQSSEPMFDKPFTVNSFDISDAASQEGNEIQSPPQSCSLPDRVPKSGRKSAYKWRKSAPIFSSSPYARTRQRKPSQRIIMSDDTITQVLASVEHPKGSAASPKDTLTSVNEGTATFGSGEHNSNTSNIGNTSITPIASSTLSTDSAAEH